MTDNEEEPRHVKPARHRRTRRYVLAALGGVAAAGGLAAASLYPRSDEGAAEERSLPPETVDVTRETLKETRTEEGDLVYEHSAVLTAAGIGTVTKVPEPGTSVEQGGELYRVDDKPVLLFQGKLPFYRELGPGDRGDDVRQLERNLTELGYDGFEADDSFTYYTGTALAQWQKDNGLDDSGTFDPGTVAVAESDIRVNAVEVDKGQKLAGGEEVLTYSGRERKVIVELAENKASGIAEEDEVTVSVPGSDPLKGVVSSVSMADTTDPDTGEKTTRVEIGIDLDDPSAVTDVETAGVDVDFAGRVREDVLTVPVSALVVLPGNGYGVEAVREGKAEYLPVETGLFADGNVEISGEGVEEGLRVGVPT
ncbi:peptidoglycan-binding protein [Haloglycomyces albus]|uniref:peptidoglycan-binding protein n=1 Tax=Haloglycomyces albus TaxID=526067 RepID=UPI00046CED52|nr:peptidoglycan-binding protein [Haloglycomyces albus]